MVSVAATDAAGAEQGSDPIVFTITRSGSLTNQVVVNLTWSGAAVFGTDYTVTVTGGTPVRERLEVDVGGRLDGRDDHGSPDR